MAMEKVECMLKGQKCPSLDILESLDRNVEAHASRIILHMLHLTTNPYSSRNGETVHVDTC